MTRRPPLKKLQQAILRDLWQHDELLDVLEVGQIEHPQEQIYLKGENKDVPIGVVVKLGLADGDVSGSATEYDYDVQFRVVATADWLDATGTNRTLQLTELQGVHSLLTERAEVGFGIRNFEHTGINAEADLSRPDAGQFEYMVQHSFNQASGGNYPYSDH